MKTSLYVQGMTPNEVDMAINQGIDRFMWTTKCDRSNVVLRAHPTVFTRLKYLPGVTVNNYCDMYTLYGVKVYSDYCVMEDTIVIMNEHPRYSPIEFNGKIHLDPDEYNLYSRARCRAQFYDLPDSVRYSLEVLGIFDKDKTEEALMLKKLQIKKVIYNAPATIVYWEDGDKTVVKCSECQGRNDCSVCFECHNFDKEKGLAMAMCKRMANDRGNYNNIFRKWCE